MLENSDAKVVVVEDAEQLAKVRAVRDRLPKLEHIVLIEGEDETAIAMSALAARGEGRDPAEWEQRYRSVTAEDICTFIYTSGTTGPPKGCVISHGNYRAMLDMTQQAQVLESGQIAYLFLPLAHSFALLIQLGSFDIGGTLAYWERDPLKIVPNLTEVRPHYFPSVPRIFEKIYTAATADVEKEGGLKKRDLLVGDRRRPQGPRAGAPRRAARASCCRSSTTFADKQVLSKIRGLFGGRITQCVTGAAPINPEILRFFDAAGVLILEGYGMTETSTAATISTPEAHKFGTVGRAFEGCEVKIADDGEVLIKGPNIFQGYYKNEEATRADDRRRLAPHRRHRRDRRRRLPVDHRPQEGHHHHRGRQEHHPRQPRGRDQAAPAGQPVRGDRRPPALPRRAGHARPRGGRQVGRRARARGGPRRRSPPTTRSAPRSRPTSTRSTRSSPGSSRSRRSRSSRTTSRRRAAS